MLVRLYLVVYEHERTLCSGQSGSRTARELMKKA